MLSFEKFNKMFDQTFDGMPYRNPILGYFKTEKEMKKAVEESGVVRKKGGAWAIPLVRIVVEKSDRKLYRRRGDFIWVVNPKYEAWRRRQWGRAQYAEERQEAMDDLAKETGEDAGSD